MQGRGVGEHEARDAVAVLGLGDEAFARSARAIGFDQAARIEVAFDRGVNGSTRIEGMQAGAEALARGIAREIGLGDDEPVREDDLLSRFRRALERVDAVCCIDHGRDYLDVEFAAQRAIGGEGLQDRSRIGEPARLDQDALELRDLAVRALGHEIAQRDLQVGADVAAQAAVAEQGHLVGRAAHQRVVDTHAAELVDDDGGAFAFGRFEKTPNQRGLARAEEAADDGHRQLGAARALEPAAEPAGIT